MLLSQATKKLGFWSTVLATGFSIAYVVGQLVEWAGLLGSKGGPESGSTVLAVHFRHSPADVTGR